MTQVYRCNIRTFSSQFWMFAAMFTFSGGESHPATLAALLVPFGLAMIGSGYIQAGVSLSAMLGSGALSLFFFAPVASPRYFHLFFAVLVVTLMLSCITAFIAKEEHVDVPFWRLFIEALPCGVGLVLALPLQRSKKKRRLAFT